MKRLVPGDKGFFLIFMHRIRQPHGKDCYQFLTLILMISLGSRSIHTKREDARKQNRRVSSQTLSLLPEVVSIVPLFMNHG